MTDWTNNLLGLMRIITALVLIGLAELTKCFDDSGTLIYMTWGYMHCCALLQNKLIEGTI